MFSLEGTVFGVALVVKATDNYHLLSGRPLFWFDQKLKLLPSQGAWLVLVLMCQSTLGSLRVSSHCVAFYHMRVLDFLPSSKFFQCASSNATVRW